MENLEQFYRNTLEEKLRQVEKSIPRVYFTREELDFFKFVKEAKHNIDPKLFEEFMEKYCEMRKKYVLKSIRYF